MKGRLVVALALGLGIMGTATAQIILAGQSAQTVTTLKDGSTLTMKKDGIGTDFFFDNKTNKPMEFDVHKGTPEKNIAIVKVMVPASGTTQLYLLENYKNLGKGMLTLDEHTGGTRETMGASEDNRVDMKEITLAK